MSEPSDDAPGAPTSRSRLTSVTLDTASISRGNPNVEHEREVAIYDLIDENSFALDGRDDGPYTLTLGIAQDRLSFTVGSETVDGEVAFILSLSPFRKIIKDYFLVCTTYYEAIRTAPPSKIQAIDMGRRGLHDEGSQLLIERLKGKITIDHTTARRLFTLICTLHWKG